MRMIRSVITGLITTLLFGTTGTQATAPQSLSLGAYSRSLNAPARVAIDGAGRIYVVDSPAGKVAVFDNFGKLVDSRDGFATPLGVAVDSNGLIYLGEEQTGSVSVFDPQWNFLYKLGSGDGEFMLPGHIATDNSTTPTRICVSDGLANAVKIYAETNQVASFGSPGTGNGQFDFPAGVCISSNGEIYVMDQGNDRAQVFDRNGVFIRLIKFGGMLGPSGRKQGILLDPAGRLYVADSFQGCVKVYDASSGTAWGTIGNFGELQGQLGLPSALALDPFNRLFIASTGNRRVEIFGLDSFVHLTTEPASDSVPSGTPVVLKAITNGDGPFTFQWLKDATALQDGAAITGSTNETLTLSSSCEPDSGNYSVIVTGPAQTITSSTTRVSVQTPPSIFADPQSRTVLANEAAQFTVGATGSALAYQWQLNGLDLTGATNDTLTISEAQAFNTGSYSVTVRNNTGSATSGAASLTVLTPPIVMEFLALAIQADLPPVLTINSEIAHTYAIDASTNLADWAPISTFVNNDGILDINDPDATNCMQRFYRMRWIP